MLDTFLKKYAWTARLALLFAAAWLAARTVNTVAGAFVRPRPTVNLAAGPATQVRGDVRPQLQAGKLYALFGQKPPAAPAEGTGVAPEAAATPQNCGDRHAAPVKTALRAQLVAGVLADDPRASIASITDLNTRETRIYGVGDAVLGAPLLSVERVRDPRDAAGTGFKVAAILCEHGQKTFLDFDGGEGAPPPGPAPTAAFVGRPPGGADEGAPASLPANEGVRKLADNRYDVKKKYIDETLSNLNSVATQARIVPSFKNGVANGFKVFSIQPNSLYSAIGVENGDVIQRINGYEINSPDKALEVYQKLREAPHITIEIERNGQTLRKDYNISGP